MPVNELWVEGKLDTVILTAVLKGRPLVRRGGSKTSLKPRLETEREIRKSASLCYVRDRDFDYEPPQDRTRPTAHAKGTDGKALGWYWCRHELESYLLEPAIVAQAIGCDEGAYRAALADAGHRIRNYQAARGAIGVIRRNLPPNYKFQTLPDDIPDDSLRLPADLSAEDVARWARDQAGRFRDRICPQLAPEAVARVIDQLCGVLSDDLLTSVDEILVRLSGKDLMAALGPWLAERSLKDPGDFRARLRDWVEAHPEDAVSFLPEWSNFIAMLNDY